MNQHETLLALADELNGGAVVAALFDAIDNGQAHNWDCDQFNRWLIGVMRRAARADHTATGATVNPSPDPSTDLFCEILASEVETP